MRRERREETGVKGWVGLGLSVREAGRLEGREWAGRWTGWEAGGLGCRDWAGWLAGRVLSAITVGLRPDWPAVRGLKPLAGEGLMGLMGLSGIEESVDSMVFTALIGFMNIIGFLELICFIGFIVALGFMNVTCFTGLLSWIVVIVWLWGEQRPG